MFEIIYLTIDASKSVILCQPGQLHGYGLGLGNISKLH